ncbi:U32 family peptidase [Ruminococcus sp. YE282]|jgi:putative protease|uniref:peptidase U32 family protein n=1 Tax=Ruminococcus sp. YE282 TaxID=3158780 RepID=UPI0008846828|nr:putative protease [Ruminococcus bromii]
MTMNKPEILSPAGDMECLNSALNFGADAVFLAGKMFGMRSAPKNFDNSDLKKACELAHSLGRKVHLTCNILPHNSELSALPDFLAYAQECGVDAFIIADLGIFEAAKKYAPKVARHISTQAGVTNYATANVLYNMGASRVVLAREIPLDEIAEMRAKVPSKLEIECFVHGAMCVSFSGRCLISSYMTGRDANHGDCAQPCRWKYHLFEENREGQYFPVEETGDGTYLYNSRDLCMIEHIPELVKAGISSFKIEGRAKSAYYTAVTTNAYRHAVDGYFANTENFVLKPWIKEELDKISHREYNTGFYFNHEPGQVTGNGGYIRHYDAVAVCEKSIDDSTSIISQRNKFYVGDTLDVLPPSGIPFLTKCLSLENKDGIMVESAPHPTERLTMKSDHVIPQSSVIRKKK